MDNPALAQKAGTKVMNAHEQHLHGPGCSHLAIVHLGRSGLPHVGFLLESGSLECYSPALLDQANIPRGSLRAVCLKARNRTYCLHRRSVNCTTSWDCWTSPTPLVLASDDACSLTSSEGVLSDLVTQTSSSHDQHNDDQILPRGVVRHIDHVDTLMNYGHDDSLQVHCDKGGEGKGCRVISVLDPYRAPTEACEGQQPTSCSDLFVLPNQVCTSVVKVLEGFCCKKEVAKVDAAVNTGGNARERGYKIYVDSKEKTVIVWHGEEDDQIADWLMTAVTRLKEQGMPSEVVSLAGIATVRSSFATDKGLSVWEQALVGTIPGVLELTTRVDPGQIEVQHLATSTMALMQTVSLERLGVLTLVNGSPVHNESIVISKGLCCSKDLPKLENTLLPLYIDGTICAFQPFPKEKRVEVTLWPGNSMEMNLESVIAKLNHSGFVVPPIQVEKPLEPETKAHATNVLVPQEDLPTRATVASLDQLVPQDLTTLPAVVKLARCTLSIGGVCCQSEVPSVVSICQNIPGVVKANVSIITRQLFIEYNPSFDQVPEEAAKALTDGSFPSEVIRSAKAIGLDKSPKKISILARITPYTSCYGLRWNVILATILWLISWVSYAPNMNVLKYLSVVAVALSLPNIAIKGLKSLHRRQVLDINMLMSIAVIGALALQDFHEAASVTVIFSWSDWLEDRASGRAKKALLTLMELKPVTARTEDGEEIAADDVELGQVLVVRTGDKVPVDGELLSSGCEVDESTLTGEARPVFKHSGDLLNAGTINVSDFWVSMRATATAENSAFARMILLVEEAASSRSPIEKIVESVAKYYTPLVVLVALLMMTIPWASGRTVGQYWLRTGLTLLVVACPCALIISTPVTYVCALAQAAQFGVIIKGGMYLETLAHIQVIACDKTGTLTRGEFEVDAIFLCLDTLTERQSYELLSNIELHATHPIAKSIFRFCQNKLAGSASDVNSTVQVDSTTIIPGRGMKAVLSDGGTAFVLSHNGMQINVENECKVSPNSQVDIWCQGQVSRGRTVSCLIFNGKIILALAASDQIRDSTLSAINEMQSKLSVDVVVLTGDNAGAASMLSEQVPGLTRIFAGLKPNQKVEHVTSLKQSGKVKVAMVGDGVNDAPALAASDVGIAMGVGGTPLALETADCALMDNDLTKIPRLIRLARRTRVKIIQNITFSLLSKGVMLGLTIAGYISLGVAIAVDVASMLLVTANGVALISGKVSEKPKAKPSEVATQSATASSIV